MFLDPMKILHACHLGHNAVVADFGAGTGFLSRAAAKIALGGSVYAIEILPPMVERLGKEAAAEHLLNLHPIWGDIERLQGTSLADKAVDFVMLANVLFQLEHKTGCLEEVKRVLKPDGRVLVVDWEESFGSMGPAPHQVFSKKAALELFERSGFTLVREVAPSGEHHYAILFKKS